MLVDRFLFYSTDPIFQILDFGLNENYMDNLEKSLPFLIVAGIILATFIVAFLVRWLYWRVIKRSILEKADPTNYRFFGHLISFVIYLTGFGLAIYQIESLRGLANSLLAGAGILAAAVGLASQKAFSNIVSGVFIVMFKPYRINDRVVIRDILQGVVEDITLRHTVIRNFQNQRIVIPNSIISDEVIVNSDLVEEQVCNFIEIGIAYDSDIPKAKALLREEVEKHPLLIDNRNPEQIAEGQPKVQVRVLALGDFFVTLRAWAWTASQADGFVLKCDILERMVIRYRAEGVEIPFPYRTLQYKDSTPLPESEEN